MAGDYLGWGGRVWREDAGIPGSDLHSSSPSPTPLHGQGRAELGRHRPVGEGEGRAGRPRPRPPRPLSREEERAALRPRDVERSRDDKARSSRAAGGTTGEVRLLGVQDPSVSRRPAPISTSISSLFSDHSITRSLTFTALAHDLHRYLAPGSAQHGTPPKAPVTSLHTNKPSSPDPSS